MISPMYPSPKDPVYGTFVKTYMDNFVKLNHGGVTHLLCIRGRNHNLYVKAVKYLKFYSQILFHLIFFRYDVIYIHTITTTILPIRLVANFRRMNLVFNVHGADVITVSKKTERLKQMAIPLLYKSLMIVSPSEYYKNVVLKMIPGFLPNKIFVSPSGGVDLNKFRPLGLEKSVVTIGYVSRIDYGKGWDLFVQLISLLKKNGYSVKGIIAGRGAEEEKLRLLVEDNKLSHDVSLIGPVAHSDLPMLFNSFDVFVFPSIRNSESLGLVGIEALACGVPVVGSNIAGIPGYVEDGVNGYLFEPGDVNDLYVKVVQYLSLSQNERKKMAEKARISAMRYDTISSMKELYNKLESIKLINRSDGHY